MECGELAERDRRHKFGPPTIPIVSRPESKRCAGARFFLRRKSHFPPLVCPHPKPQCAEQARHCGTGARRSRSLCTLEQPKGRGRGSVDCRRFACPLPLRSRGSHTAQTTCGYAGALTPCSKAPRLRLPRSSAPAPHQLRASPTPTQQNSFCLRKRKRCAGARFFLRRKSHFPPLVCPHPKPQCAEQARHCGTRGHGSLHLGALEQPIGTGRRLRRWPP